MAERHGYNPPGATELAAISSLSISLTISRRERGEGARPNCILIGERDDDDREGARGGGISERGGCIYCFRSRHSV